jgi:hypothetical protein
LASDGGTDTATGTLYIWLEGDPMGAEPDVTIPDTPGVNDLDQIANAIRDGLLGRYLPVTLSFSTNPQPTSPRTIRSLDVAKLLRDRHIRHRRRYEVIGDGEGHLDSDPLD